MKLRTILLLALGATGCHAAALPLDGNADDAVAPVTPSCAPATGAWAVEAVATPGTTPGAFGPLGSSTSLAATTYAAAFIAYGGSLHLATRDVLGWTTESLDVQDPPYDEGFGSVVRLDRAGRPVIVVADRVGPSTLLVRFPDGEKTQIQSPVIEVALALDADDLPRVAYEEGNVGLSYASWDGAAWHVEPISTALSLMPVIALDAAGEPTIAYNEPPRLRVARRSADGTWNVETVDTSTQEMTLPSLAIDSAGRPHVSYEDGATGALKHAVRDDGGWSIESVPGIKDLAESSMALDCADQPHIAFTHRVVAKELGPLLPATLDYAVKDPAGHWSITTIRDAGESATEPSLVLPADGVPRVSWFDVSTGTLFYAARR